MHYLVLNKWSKLQTKLTIYLGDLGRTKEKTTKKQPKSSEQLKQK